MLKEVKILKSKLIYNQRKIIIRNDFSKGRFNKTFVNFDFKGKKIFS